MKGGSIYLLFSYEVPSQKEVSRAPEALPLEATPEKVAGLDLGVARLASIYIHDEMSPSLLIDGKEFSSFNAEYNRKNAKIWSALAPLKNQMRSIEKAVRQSQGFVPLATLRESREDYRALSVEASALEKRLTKLSRQRRHFFDTNFKKLSKRLVAHLSDQGVTHLVTSRNILDIKTEGPAMGRVQNQRFYHIPFAQFLDSLKLFAGRVGLKVSDDLDEAYSSKTSSVSGDICKAQEVLKGEVRYDATVRSDVFKGKRVKRGLYKDGPRAHLLHADINAAANLVKLELAKNCWNGEKAHRGWDQMPLWKLANPRNLMKDALLSHLDRAVPPFGLCLKEELAPANGGLRFEVAG
jgi:transposase